MGKGGWLWLLDLAEAGAVPVSLYSQGQWVCPPWCYLDLARHALKNPSSLLWGCQVARRNRASHGASDWSYLPLEGVEM